METFSALLAICAGNSPASGEFPAQRPVTRSFDVFYDLRRNKRLSNNRKAGDLRRFRSHYDVIVMINSIIIVTSNGMSPVERQAFSETKAKYFPFGKVKSESNHNNFLETKRKMHQKRRRTNACQFNYLIYESYNWKFRQSDQKYSKFSSI